MEHDKGPLLGRQVAGRAEYAPELLFPVPRANARASLPAGEFAGFGADIWHCYELSWLESSPAGPRPVVYVGVLTVPASSPCLVESKSLKLYLNSLNQHCFSDRHAAQECIERDVSAVCGAAVTLALYDPDDARFDGTALEGFCLDNEGAPFPSAPDVSLIERAGGEGGCYYSHRLRSLCPVTAQPDWATVVIEMRGAAPDTRGLAAYLLGYREHREFHEQCVERIFTDIGERLAPDVLVVQALYTRRGGLAISPWRCSEDRPAPLRRLNRQ
jgi:7-cyano-7-deazaguanine reductase